MSLKDNLASRRHMLDAIRAEVVGPDPQGCVLAALPVELTQDQERALSVAQQPDGEEILITGDPGFRYGAGVLHPPEPPSTTGAVEEALLSDDVSEPEEALDDVAQSRARRRSYEPESDDFSISSTNSFKPSVIAVSCVINLAALHASVRLELADGRRHARDDVRFNDCGFYVPHMVKVVSDQGAPVREANWWLRRPARDLSGERPSIELFAADFAKSGFRDIPVHGFSGHLRVSWHVRSWPGAPEHCCLVTFSLRNVGGQGGRDVLSLFQSGLLATVPSGALAPYPTALVPAEASSDPLDEDRINRVLYRRRHVYAVGHGCAADWDIKAPDTWRIWTDVMPAFEMAPMSFDVRRPDGTALDLSMRSMARIVGSPPSEAVDAMLEELITLYEGWIASLDPGELAGDLDQTGRALVQRCQESARRMRGGLRIMKEEPQARRAFELANEAMLMAQHRRPSAARVPSFSGDVAQWLVGYTRLDLADPALLERENDAARPIGRWRPFQLAFLLMSIEGVVYDNGEDRELVDLIWFPTGGGKTEAYLGLSAFTVFYNALTGRSNPESGHVRAVTILMRYTLRLLTAQQFQRAVTLFCAMELIRQRGEDALGSDRFTVGLWVGDSTTPNRMESADRAISLLEGETLKLRPGEDRDANPFVLLQCPWCSAEFGRVAQKGRGRFWVHGYAARGAGQNKRLVYICPDSACEFGPGRDPVPAVVVDENVYRRPPSLLIGTVDKFAMLAWRAEARSLFGLASDGSRVARGPELIIQDELHLMTGPLGTMVGLFETAVDWLCRADGGATPKIIASTATAARAGEQVRALYARQEMRVFPPAGLDAADSFFARENPNQAGRLYVGVLAPGHGSMQTTQRQVFASLMQAAADIALNADPARAAELADPWWTVLAYYNSLRELGGALTLFGSDIPDQLEVLRKRRGLDWRSVRRAYVDGRVMELTSRISSGDVPESLRLLEEPIDGFTEEDGQLTVRLQRGSRVQDACLASNIIEVGVDVPRLALMTIVGQPKTTSSYIQASSRVGRREDRPGLVVMLYSTTKPRDRSHYERFRPYHQAIYAWVEPTSVTPFSPPAVNRALHAVLVALARQLSAESATPKDVIRCDELFEQIAQVFANRASVVAREDERVGVEKRMGLLQQRWRAYDPDTWNWSGWGAPPLDPPLIHASGGACPPGWVGRTWETPQSLRAVDAVCEAGITTCYVDLKASGEDY